jgi:hypothetical protein
MESDPSSSVLLPGVWRVGRAVDREVPRPDAGSAPSGLAVRGRSDRQGRGRREEHEGGGSSGPRGCLQTCLGTCARSGVAGLGSGVGVPTRSSPSPLTGKRGAKVDPSFADVVEMSPLPNRGRNRESGPPCVTNPTFVAQSKAAALRWDRRRNRRLDQELSSLPRRDQPSAGRAAVPARRPPKAGLLQSRGGQPASGKGRFRDRLAGTARLFSSRAGRCDVGAPGNRGQDGGLGLSLEVVARRVRAVRVGSVAWRPRAAGHEGPRAQPGRRDPVDGKLRPAEIALALWPRRSGRVGTA